MGPVKKHKKLTRRQKTQKLIRKLLKENKKLREFEFEAELSRYLVLEYT